MAKEKLQINKEHPRIANRSKSQQKYRDKLAATLKAERKANGLKAASHVLDAEKKENPIEYIVSECGGYNNEAAKKIVKLKFAYSKEVAKDGDLVQKDIDGKTFILENLKKFEGPLDFSFFQELMDNDIVGIGDVLDNIEKFSDHEKIVEYSLSKFKEYLEKAEQNNRFGRKLTVNKTDFMLWDQRIECYINRNISKIGMDHQKLFELYINTYGNKGDYERIVNKIYRNKKTGQLRGVDNKKIINMLLELSEGIWAISGEGDRQYTIELLEDVEGLDMSDYEKIFNKVIKQCGVNYHFLKTFSWKSGKEVFDILMKEGEFDWGGATNEYLLKKLKKEGVSLDEIAMKLIDAGQGELLFNVNYRNKFGKLSQEVCEKLISSGLGRKVGEHLENFIINDNEKIINMIIDSGKGGVLLNRLPLRMKGVDDQEIVMKLIDKGLGKHIAWYNAIVKTLDRKEIAKKLLEKGFGKDLILNLRYYKNLDGNMALDLINYIGNSDDNKISESFVKKLRPGQYCGDTYANVLIDQLDSFKDVDHMLFLKNLLKQLTGQEYEIKTETFDDKLAKILIGAGAGVYVLKYPNKFPGINIDEIIDLMIEQGQGNFVPKYFKAFHGSDELEIAYKLINNGNEKSLIRYICNFNKKNHKQIVEKLIELGHEDLVADGLYHWYLKGGLDEEIAKKLVKAGYERQVWSHLDVFGLEPSMFKKILIGLESLTDGNLIYQNHRRKVKKKIG